MIKETLRLYPPVLMYVRDIIAADIIDGVPGHQPQIDTASTLISKNGLPMIIRRC